MTKKIAQQKNNFNHSLLILAPVLLLFLSLTTTILPVQSSSSQIIGTVSVTPLKLGLKARKSVLVNQNFNLQSTIKNVGQNSINDITLTLQLPAELVLVQGELVQDIGTLNPKKSKKVSWEIKASQPGIHVVQVSISGIEQGTGEPVSTTASATIKAKQKRFYHSIFQSWLNFFNSIFQQ